MNRLKPDVSGIDTPEMKQMIEQELNALKNDELVYPVISEKLHLTQKEAEKYLAALLDYQEDVHYCAACPGLEKCGKAHPHFCLSLEKENGVLTRHYEPCAKMLSLASFRNRYIRCSFSEDQRDDRFKDIERSVSSRKEFVRDVAQILLRDSKKWIYLTGRAGSGKSYMLA